MIFTVTPTLKSYIICMCAFLMIGLIACNDDEMDEMNEEFCYSLETNTEVYQSISNGTELSLLNSDDVYVVDIGFEFDFCGVQFTELYIAWDLSPTFTYEKNGDTLDLQYYELIPFGVHSIEQDLESTISYETKGNAGNRITTIEFKDFHYQEIDWSDTYNISYQIKLYEDGNKISFHYGPNNVETDFSSNIFERLDIGLYGNDKKDGVFLKGNPSNPSISSVPGSSGVNACPVEGRVYTFE